MAAELMDRFGPRPPVVERLLRLMELRILAQSWRIDSIHLEDSFAVLRYLNRPKIEELARASGKRLRIVDEASAYLPLDKGLRDPDAIVSEIESLLLCDGRSP
jgi:transcription-repair coupling factor (superfamily II helicase)